MIDFDNLKRFLKNKVRVTTATLTAFLIVGSFAFANDPNGNGITIYGGQGIITDKNLNTKVTTTNEAGKGSFDGNIQGNVIIDNSKKSGATVAFAQTQNPSGNGIDVDGKTVTLNNNGLILGSVTLTGGTATANALAFAAAATGNGINGSLTGNNNGTISGKATLTGGTATANALAFAAAATGNGINGSLTGNNNGTISGKATLTGGTATANALAFAAAATGNGINGSLTGNNNGTISGKATLTGGTATANALAFAAAAATGNGINGSLTGNNNGTISGYINFKSGLADKKLDYQQNDFSGNGIIKANNIVNITNAGVIKGSAGALAAASIGTVDNYGILAGRQIFSDGVEVYNNETTNSKTKDKSLGTIIPTKENNLGIYIKLKEDPKLGTYTASNYNVKNSQFGEFVLLDKNGNPAIEEITIGKGGEQKDLDLGFGKYNYYVFNGYKDGSIANNTQNSATSDTYITAKNLKSKNNNQYLILNASGIEDGHAALVVDENIEVNDSIFNGYNTALFLQGGNKFTGRNNIFNGGGLKGDKPVIKGDGNDNTAEILGNSIINGNVDLGDGDDTLTLSINTCLNGDLLGGSGTKDTLNLGETKNPTQNLSNNAPNLRIFGNISGFEDININNGDVTLFENANINGKEFNINLNNGGNLILRIDPTKKDSNGNYIGHALYGGKDRGAAAGNKGHLHSNGGDLILGLNGIGDGGTLAFGDTDLDNIFGSGNKSKHIRTNSTVLNAHVNKNSQGNLTVNFNTKPNLPTTGGQGQGTVILDADTYNDLSKVYRAIESAGEINNGAIANTTDTDDSNYDEKVKALYSLLDQMKYNNPYSYTFKSSRDSLKVFENNMSYLTVTPKLGEIIVQGKAIYARIKSDTQSNGSYKTSNGYNTNHRTYKTTTNTKGGIATIEYGLDNNTSVGIALGGNHQDISFKGTSKIKGNSAYIGTFIKNQVNGFKLKTGIGYQYTSNDVNRVVANGYDVLKTSGNYAVNGINAFAQLKYSLKANNSWIIEPNVKANYYWLHQSRVREKYKSDALVLQVNKGNSISCDISVGADAIKETMLKTGRLKNVFSFKVINTIGNKKNPLQAKVIGKTKEGSSFKLSGVKYPATIGKVGYTLELEKTNGMIYSLGASLEFSKDYNKNVDVNVGLGYKF